MTEFISLIFKLISIFKKEYTYSIKKCDTEKPYQCKLVINNLTNEKRNLVAKVEFKNCDPTKGNGKIKFSLEPNSSLTKFPLVDYEKITISDERFPKKILKTFLQKDLE